MVTGVSPKDSARAAFGDAQRSVAVHVLNESMNGMQAEGGESYNQESRVHSTLLNRSLVFAGLHGSSIASTILALTRVLSTKCYAHGTLADSSSSGGSSSATRLRSSIVPIVAAAAIPCSISLGYLIWASMECERFFERREREREKWEMQNFPEGEIAEMVSIYQSRGLSHKDAQEVVRIFSQNEEVFLDLMMVEELGYSRFGMPSGKETLWRGSLPAVVSHCVCITLPLLPLLWFMKHPRQQPPTAASWSLAVLVSDGVLVAQSLGLSVLQSMLLHGAYANLGNSAPVVLGNAVWMGALYATARGLANILLQPSTQ